MEDDYYALLGIPSTANDEMIQRGYRKAALRYHPDKNKEASAIEIFHKIAVAFDVLSDPISRSSYDSSRESLLAKKRKYEALDKERKRMIDELERLDKEAKLRKIKSETAMEATLRKLQEEGAALRKKKEAALRAQRESEKQMESHNDEKVLKTKEEEKSRFTMENRTIKVRWRRDQITIDKDGLINAFERFGKIEDVVLKDSIDNTKKKKVIVGLIVFKSVVSAHAAISEASLLAETPFIHLKEVSWAKQAPDLTGISEDVTLNEIHNSNTSKNTSLPRSNTMPCLNQNHLDYQNIILMRMREAEREKITNNILQSDNQI
ncbi:hypothetical protein T552_01539 [Pneumocystis carinii B80]|uniref:J domain-containing protein n=1 Tax=Pneumocystis carinii (strain B80) TaxID=1408658 RepID=A0A0W4ZKL5_PNEC8|nr:hypothetical protein T552_01539 [Pneumocystis carinii B80]KTW28912.1 hypothetical protein T552_01539 [Pneumocystis carinii B80]